MSERKALYRDPTTGVVSEVPSGDLVAQADATAIQGEPVNSGTPTAGNILVFSGTEWVPGDPLVQGVYDPGTNTTTGGISSGYIKPVLIGGSDYSGTPLLHDLKVDSSGQIYLGATSNVIGKVSQDTSPWIVAGNLSDGGTLSTVNVGALVAHATTTRVVHTSGKQYLLNMDLEGHLRTRTRSENLLGDVSIAPRNNQIELNFSIAFASLPVTNTPTGTGTATQSGGQATYSSGGTSGGRAIGQSTQTLVYRPGHEYYADFTAMFSTGGTGAGFQRIGMYNATDGFWIGYEGGTFGLTHFVGGAPTQIAKSSWNGDPLDGSANSAFTSAGSPVALNLQKINIYRIHGSWFGSAPVRLEVLSPDSEWVLCHTFLFPNTLTVPYAATTNWSLTVDVQSASATPVSVSVPCMAAGTQDQNFGITDTITDNSLAILGRSVIVGHTTAGGGSYVNVKVNPSGALSAAVTAADGDVFVRSNAASTFPVTATLSAETTKVIGTVNQGTSPWVVSATLGAETTKVIGVVRTADGSGNLLTSTSNALDVNVKSSTLSDPAEFTAATTSAPSKVLLIGGKSADGTPVYNPLPLAAGSGSLVISGSVTQGTAAASTAPWPTRPGAPTTGAWSTAVINFSGSGDNTIVAGVGGQTIRVFAIEFTAGGATNVKFGDTTVTYVTGAMVMTGNGSAYSKFMNGEPIFPVTATGKGFLINSSSAVSIQGIVHYTIS